jgi:hypothetical protein
MIRFRERFWRQAAALFAALLGLVPFAASPSRADPAMWVVKNADATVYMLGTIHALRSDVKWRSEKLEAAFKASDQYWMEADIEEDPAVAQTYALNFGTDSQHPLSEKLSAADYAIFLKCATALKLPEAQVKFMRPWLAGIMVEGGGIQSSGFDPQYGVDRSLETDAKAAGKPVKTFETVSQQLGFIADLPEPVEVEMLVQQLHNLHWKHPGDKNPDDASDHGSKIDALEAAWLAGDTERLASDIFRDSSESKEFYDVLITKRNANWIPQIEALLQTPGTYFIAVGAGHLVGGAGLPVLLAKRGYKVARY